jgi:hypothetical protein
VAPSVDRRSGHVPSTRGNRSAAVRFDIGEPAERPPGEVADGCAQARRQPERLSRVVRPAHAGAAPVEASAAPGVPLRGVTTTGWVAASTSASETLPASARCSGP